MKSVLLAIETSCDDTAAAVIIDGHVASNVVSTQDIHAQFGGVVPELASRAHQTYIVPVVKAALQQASISLNELSAIAFTNGPGLMGSLLVGVSFAKGLALSLKIPLLAVHHLHAHVLSPFAETDQPTFPYLCLLVSGGHTQIIQVESPLSMTILGTSLDDAAGEAFDKAGKLLGLSYPAGPQIDQLARSGIPRFTFAHPQLSGYNFSFSGIKTAIRYFLRDAIAQNPDFIQENLSDICASVQGEIVSILLHTLSRASKDTGIKTIALAGGVAANSHLRDQFKELGAINQWRTFIPSMGYSTDNAAMIGIAGYYKYQAGQFAELSIKADPRWPFLVK